MYLYMHIHLHVHFVNIFTLLKRKRPYMNESVTGKMYTHTYIMMIYRYTDKALPHNHTHSKPSSSPSYLLVHTLTRSFSLSHLQPHSHAFIHTQIKSP